MVTRIGRTGENQTVTSSPDAELVESAALALEGVVAATPLERNQRLSERFGAEIWFKREDLQVVRSYKVRGAYYTLSTLTPEQRARGVICASAGNHAQGVAFACAQMQVHGRVYLPRNTPRQKRQRIAVLGGEYVEIVVFGDNYDEAAAMAGSRTPRRPRSPRRWPPRTPGTPAPR